MNAMDARDRGMVRAKGGRMEAVSVDLKDEDALNG